MSPRASCPRWPLGDTAATRALATKRWESSLETITDVGAELDNHTSDNHEGHGVRSRREDLLGFDKVGDVAILIDAASLVSSLRETNNIELCNKTLCQLGDASDGR